MVNGNFLKNLTKERITFHLTEWTFLIESARVKLVRKIQEENRIRFNILKKKSLHKILLLPHLTSDKFNQNKQKLLIHLQKYHECLQCLQENLQRHNKQ